MYVALSSLLACATLRPSGHWSSLAGLLGSKAISAVVGVGSVLFGDRSGDSGREGDSSRERYSSSSLEAEVRVGDIGFVDAVVNDFVVQ